MKLTPVRFAPGTNPTDQKQMIRFPRKEDTPIAYPEPKYPLVNLLEPLYITVPGVREPFNGAEYSRSYRLVQTF